MTRLAKAHKCVLGLEKKEMVLTVSMGGLFVKPHGKYTVDDSKQLGWSQKHIDSNIKLSVNFLSNTRF